MLLVKGFHNGNPIFQFLKMSMNNKPVSVNGMLAFSILLLNAVIMETALVKDYSWSQLLWITLPLFALSIQRKKKENDFAAKK